MLRNSLILFLGTIVLFFGTVQAADDSLLLRGPWGLNTTQGDFSAPFGMGRVVHNWDLGSGTLHRRSGYNLADSVSATYDSIVGTANASYRSDSRQSLIMVAALKDSGYGRILTTAYNSNSLTSPLNAYVNYGIQSRPSFAQLNNIVYVANGNERMVAFSGLGSVGVKDSARMVPPLAPGEIEMWPLATGNLNGEYIYAYTMRESKAQDTTRLSYISPKIRVANGRVRFYTTGRPLADSIDTTPDSVRFKIYRTIANPGPLRPSTKFYYTGLSITDSLPQPAKYLTDNTADGSLSAEDTIKAGEFVADRMAAPRYGQPRILNNPTISKTAGMARGTGKMHIYKWAWVVQFEDTAIHIPSDTGRRVTVDCYGAGDTTNISNVTLSLPRRPVGQPDLMINIYRAPVYWIPETLIVTVNFAAIADPNSLMGKFLINMKSTDTTMIGPGSYIPDLSPNIVGGYGDEWTQFWPRYNRHDTSVTGFFHLVGQVRTDTTFVDTFSFGSLLNKPYLNTSRPPNFLNHIVSYAGRIFGGDGSRLYMSRLDSGVFSQGQFIALNPADGDEITAIYPARTALRVFKNRSSWNVYQDGNGQWNRSEVSNGIGCIAPQSIASSASGLYYLSEQGVVLEGEGQYLERTVNAGLISAPLNNFDSLPMATKRKAVGFYFDNKYMLTIGTPPNDTAYVYDEKSGMWGTWSMPFSGATRYNVDNGVYLVPPDTMYFTKQGGRALYRYKGSKYDNGANFNMEWRSTPLMLNNDDKTVSAIGVWHKSVDTSDVLDLRVLNESGSQVAIFSDTNLVSRYGRISMPTNTSRGFYIRLLNTDYVANTGLTRTIIDGLDVFYHKGGKVGE